MKLIQHNYLRQPWRMMVACALLNQTTGTAVRPVLGELFELWPTPRSMAEAEPSDLKPVIAHLGFGNRRSETLVRMADDATSRLLAPNWYGVGKYAMDSWHLFVMGLVPTDVTDKELLAYMREVKKHHIQPPGFQAMDRWFHPKPLRIMRLTPEMAA